MSEYLAEKFELVKKAKPGEIDKLKTECTELILRLWDYRHSLPDHTRPTKDFDSILRVINDLSGSNPWNTLLRDLPEIEKNQKAREIIGSILSLDKASSSLIRFLLAEAVAMIPNENKKWAKLRSAVSTSASDIRIFLRLIEESETLAEKSTNLNKKQIEDVENMLSQLKEFERASNNLKNILENKLNSLKAH